MNNPQLEQVLRMTPQERELLYQRVFENSDAKLVLEDLKGRFFFYAPAKDLTEVGSENVIKHINNMINPMPEEIQNGQ
jgi:hypothetical protein